MDPQWSFYAGFGAEVAADAIVTISQCLLLVQMRTGLERLGICLVPQSNVWA